MKDFDLKVLPDSIKTTPMDIIPKNYFSNNSNVNKSLIDIVSEDLRSSILIMFNDYNLFPERDDNIELVLDLSEIKNKHSNNKDLVSAIEKSSYLRLRIITKIMDISWNVDKNIGMNNKVTINIYFNIIKKSVEEFKS